MTCQDSTCCLLETAFDEDGLWTGGVIRVLREGSPLPTHQRSWRGRLTTISQATKQWLLAPVGFPLQHPAARPANSH